MRYFPVISNRCAKIDSHLQGTSVCSEASSFPESLLFFPNLSGCRLRGTPRQSQDRRLCLSKHLKFALITGLAVKALQVADLCTLEYFAKQKYPIP